MTLVNLKHLLSGKSNAASIINAYVFSLGVTVCIQDVEGTVLFGELEQGVPKAQVKLGDQVLGWVSGTHAELVADVLMKLAADEEKYKEAIQAQESGETPKSKKLADIIESEHFQKLLERVEQQRRSSPK